MPKPASSPPARPRPGGRHRARRCQVLAAPALRMLRVGASFWMAAAFVMASTRTGEAFGPAPKRLEWKFATGGGVVSSPALSPDGSTVYVGSWDDNLYAVHAANGTEAWKFATGGWVRSSPALSPDGATVYVGSEDGNLYAVHAASTP